MHPVLSNSHSSAWHVEARWANGNNSIYFLLEGPVGPADMPGGANDFASWINADQQLEKDSDGHV